VRGRADAIDDHGGSLAAIRYGPSEFRVAIAVRSTQTNGSAIRGGAVPSSSVMWS
jgi:hypothetical protein